MILHSYIFYPLSLEIMSTLKKKYRLTTSEGRSPRKISILVSAYNEEGVIRRRVSDLLAIDFPAFEVIVGVDGATDNTYGALSDLVDPRLKVINFPNNRGKVWVLNDLRESAAGEILVFTDANTELDGKSLGMLERHFDDEKVGGVCGRLELRAKHGAKGSNMETAYWGVESRIKRLEGDQGVTLGGNGAIYAIRNNLFVPFDSKSRIHDDLVLPLRIIEKGFYFVYEPCALAYEESYSFDSEFRRKVKVGEAIRGSLHAAAGLISPRHGFAAYSFWSHKVIRWFVPFLLIVLALANLMLLRQGGIFVWTALCQVVFYFGAAIGIAGLYSGAEIPIAAHCGYLLIANAGIATGLTKSLFKHQDAKWEVSRD